MKLHLTKSLRTALLACVCAATVSTSWGLEINPESGTETITIGTYDEESQSWSSGTYTDDITGTGNLRIEGQGRLGDTNGGGQSINNTGTLTFAVTDTTTEIGAWPSAVSPTTIGSNVTAVTIESGDVLLTCQSILNNSGSLTIAEGASFTINTGTTAVINETVSNSGKLEIKSDVASLTYTGTLGGENGLAQLGEAQEGYSNGTSGFKATTTEYTLVSGTGTTTANNVSVKLSNEDYAGYLAHLNNGVLSVASGADTSIYYVRDNDSISADDMAAVTEKISVEAGKTLTVSSTDLTKNVELASGSTLYTQNTSAQSSSTITLLGDATIKGSGSSLYAGVVTNEGTTANLTLEKGDGVFYISSSINNAGTLAFKGDIDVKSQEKGAGYIGSNVTDVTIATGKTTFESGTTLDNNGTITIDDGATLQINEGATVNLNGVIQGAGTLALNGATVNLDAEALAGMTGDVATGYTLGHDIGGFKTSVTVYDLYNGTADLTGDTSYVKIGDSSYALYEDAKFDVGTGAEGDKSIYYVNGDHTISQTDLDAVTDKIVVAEGKSVQVDYTTLNKNVELAGGSTLNLEASGVAAGTVITIANDGTEANASTIRGWRAPVAGDVEGTGALKLMVNHSGFDVSGAINTDGRVLVTYDSTIADTSGNNTLTFKSGSSIGDNAELVVDTDAKVAIEAGANVVMNGESFVRAGGSIDVQSGATLAVNTAAEIGSANGNNLASLNLNGNAQVTGTGSIAFKGGKLVATGANNVVKANLTQAWDVNLQVDGSLELAGRLINGKVVNDSNQVTNVKLVKTGGGALTFAGAIDADSIIQHDGGTIDISNGVENVITLNMNGADFSVSGKGTSVVLNSDSSVQSGTITVGSGATLDLTNVLTLGSASLTLEGGSTIKVGPYYGDNGDGGTYGPITLGNVAITGSITIDLSSWCAMGDFQDWEVLFESGNTETFQTTIGNVTVLYTDGAVVGSYLAPTENGSGLMLVPEPTTVTLSLLALAGLAARRRRK